MKENTPTVRIMIVDDSSLMRRVLHQIIETDPRYQVVAEAGNGLEALELLPQARPDVILLDLEMPRMDGFGFLAVARRQCLARIIVVSSLARIDTPEGQRLLDAGVDDFITKPSGVVRPDIAAQRGAMLLKAVCEQARLSAAE